MIRCLKTEFHTLKSDLQKLFECNRKEEYSCIIPTSPAKGEN